MLTVHHLRQSQSERIVWLCEELELDYTLRCYERDPVTRLAPPEYKRLHPMGTAPVITDDALTLGESGAIVDYLCARHGAGRLVVGADDPAYADFLYWSHFANGALQPVMGRNMILARLALAADNAIVRSTRARLDLALGHLDERLAVVPLLAGDGLTTADIMTVFSLTTMRMFYPVDLAPFPHIGAYLQRIGARDAYRRAMAKSDPGMTPLLA